MIEIKGLKFNVEINHKRIKNLYLRLDGDTIIANAPMNMADYEVYRFIETKRNWIYRVYDSETFKRRMTRLYNGGDTFYLYNNPYKLVKLIGKKDVTIKENTIYLTYKEDNEDAIRYLYKYLDRYLLLKANEFVDRYQNGILNDYGYYLRPTLKAKIMKSKWGVCYTRKNMINISSYLIHYPIECLEYIIVHEMTHFIIPNHSKRFYQIVENNMPYYKSANDKLKL